LPRTVEDLTGSLTECNSETGVVLATVTLELQRKRAGSEYGALDLGCEEIAAL